MENRIRNILLNTLFGSLVCIIFGVLIYGIEIFDFQSSRSQIFVFGIDGAVFFSVLKYGKRKELIFIGVLIFVVNIILQGKSITFNYFLRDLLFVSSLFTALALYKLFIDNYSKLLITIRVLSLSILLGLFNAIATIILVQIFDAPNNEMINAVMLNAQYGFLVGFGLGLGFDLYEKF